MTMGIWWEKFRRNYVASANGEGKELWNLGRARGSWPRGRIPRKAGPTDWPDWLTVGPKIASPQGLHFFPSLYFVELLEIPPLRAMSWQRPNWKPGTGEKALTGCGLGAAAWQVQWLLMGHGLNKALPHVTLFPAAPGGRMNSVPMSQMRKLRFGSC